MGFAEQINHRKALHSAVSANIMNYCHDSYLTLWRTTSLSAHQGYTFLPHYYEPATDLHRLRTESTVVVFTVTKASYGFGVSFTVKTKFPAEIIRVQGILNWHSGFKWVSVISVFFLTWIFPKGHVIPHLCFLSSNEIKMSQCWALGFIWITWFLEMRYMNKEETFATSKTWVPQIVSQGWAIWTQITIE